MRLGHRHGTSAVGALHQSGKKVGKLRTFVVDVSSLAPAGDETLYKVKLLLGDNALMGVVGHNALIVRMVVPRLGFHGDHRTAACHHVTGVDRVAEDLPDGVVAPLVAVVLIHSVVFLHRRRAGDCHGTENFSFPQQISDGGNAHSLRSPLEDLPNYRGIILVNHKLVVVIRVFFVAIGRNPAHIETALGTCHLCGLDLLGDVSSVEFIEDVFEGGNVHGLIAGAVHPVIDGDILYPVLGEENLNVAARFQIVSAETGQVLGNNPFHMTGFDLCNHFLKGGTVEGGAGVAVIHKEAGVAVAVI